MRAHSSVGQSRRLITVWSQVRALVGPPIEFIKLSVCSAFLLYKYDKRKNEINPKAPGSRKFGSAVPYYGRYRNGSCISPLHLLEEGRISYAVACDIHKGPLVKAKEHIIRENRGDCVEIRLGAGIEPLTTGEVDGVTIAGMGGLMIIDILKDSPEKAHALHWLVLQPQNHVADLKYFLMNNGFVIQEERMAIEGQRLYELMKVVPGEPECEVTLFEAEVGVTEAYKKDPLFPMHIRKLIKKRDILIHSISDDNQNDRNRKKKEIALKERELLEGML